MFYEIPANLGSEIDEFESSLQRYLAGRIDAESFKALRVPFGCYEQRRNGTYMLRVRCAGGAITPHQLRTIARLSDEYGRGSIHITTRQEFQIHDIQIANVVAIIRELLSVGLSTRGGGGNTVRNIIVSPEAGIASDSAFDPSPYAFALTSRLIAEHDSWRLPRKFKVAFSASDIDSGYAQFNDLGFIATTSQSTLGFRVYVAGGMGRKPEVGHLLHEFVPVEDVYNVAESVKLVFSKYGNRTDKNKARLRFLWKDLGETRFRELYEAELYELRRKAKPLELPRATAGGASLKSSPLRDDSPEFALWKKRYVRRQRQAGLCSILIPIFLGNLNNDGAAGLARFLDSLGYDTLRATLRQNLRLRNIPDEYLGNVYTVVKNISESSSGPALVANAIACAGADTCKLGICLSKGALQAIREKLLSSGLDLDQVPDFKLNISGCPNTCGQHMIADLGFYGKVGRHGDQILPAYGVVAGAIRTDRKARFAQILGQINARDLPHFVEDLLGVWIEKKARFCSFAAYVDLEGTQDIRALCERYRPGPDSNVEDTYYVDWGASKPFSLDGKSDGECSAGPTPAGPFWLVNAR